MSMVKTTMRRKSSGIPGRKKLRKLCRAPLSLSTLAATNDKIVN